MSRSNRPQLPRTPSGSGIRRPAQPGSESQDERIRRLAAEGAKLLAAKRPGEAAVRLEEVLQADSTNVPAAINLGGAYILQGKHTRAIPVLEAAVRLEPNNAMLWSNLAAAYLGKLPFASTEQQDAAIAAYEHALALDPHAPHVHYNLGLIHAQRDEPLRAAAHFYGALETDPNDHDAQRWLDRMRNERPEDGDGPVVR